MKTLIVTLLLSATALAQSPTPAVELKDASDPQHVIVVGEIPAGTIAEAIQRYPALKTKLDAAAAKIAKEKEAALMKVKNTDAPRAKIKMDELIAAGVPITKATQDAVNAAGRPSPPPKGSPTPSPTPTPSDGL